MESVTIEQWSRKYTFYSDKIVQVTKKGRIIREISYDHVTEVTYNPKFGIKDFFTYIIGVHGGNNSYAPKSFVAYIEPSKQSGPHICLKISKENFEKVKSFFKMPIRIV